MWGNNLESPDLTPTVITSSRTRATCCCARPVARARQCSQIFQLLIIVVYLKRQALTSLKMSRTKFTHSLSPNKCGRSKEIERAPLLADRIRCGVSHYRYVGSEAAFVSLNNSNLVIKGDVYRWSTTLRMFENSSSAEITPWNDS